MFDGQRREKYQIIFSIIENNVKIELNIAHNKTHQIDCYKLLLTV